MHWIIKIGIVALVVATPVKWVSNVFGDKTYYDSPCFSSLEARLWRIYVCRARIAPSKLNYRDQEIEIKEAWIERRSKTCYLLIWFPYKKDMGGYQLCFTLEKGGEIFRSWPVPFWVSGDADHTFGICSSSSRKNNMVIYEHLETLPCSEKVSLIEGLKQPRPKDIEVTIDKK